METCKSQRALGYVQCRGSTGIGQPFVIESSHVKVVPLGSRGEKRVEAACVESARPRKLTAARANLRFLRGDVARSKRGKPLGKVGGGH